MLVKSTTVENHERVGGPLERCLTCKKEGKRRTAEVERLKEMGELKES